MHESVMQWVKSIAPDCEGPVLEVGSQNINGTVRDMFPPDYIGVDIIDGNGVDQVYDGDTLPFASQRFSTVLCLEVFEHCFNPVRLANEIMRVLAIGGTALISARGVNFPYHNPPDRLRYMAGYLEELFSRYGCEATETADPQADGWFVYVTKVKDR